MKSKIDWTERTWNVTSGCTHASIGCKNCYAERLVSTRLRHLPQNAGVTEDGRWTGKVKLLGLKLEEPVKVRKPSTFFVCSQSDLFHEEVPYLFVNQVYERMDYCTKHTFIVLTKRSKRLLEYRSGVNSDPLPNVWHGVSVSNQSDADRLIPDLLNTPSAHRFVSIEPMLGPINLAGLLIHCPEHDFAGGFCAGPCKYRRKLDFVICGGESGPNARPMHPDWVRSIRDQCKEAGVQFYFKQWGEWAPNCLCDTPRPCKEIIRPIPGKPGVMFRCGKSKSGHLLDGVEHRELPWRKEQG